MIGVVTVAESPDEGVTAAQAELVNEIDVNRVAVVEGSRECPGEPVEIHLERYLGIGMEFACPARQSVSPEASSIEV
jgi:hypothetical protein